MRRCLTVSCNECRFCLTEKPVAEKTAAAPANQHIIGTDALATLGTIIDDRQGRDAIHLAVENVVAGESIWPGQHLTLEGGVAFCTLEGKRVGIADPFVRGPIGAGQRFWLLVYPRQITSLRHVWEHPDFPPSTAPVAAPPAAVPAPPPTSLSFLAAVEAAANIESWGDDILPPVVGSRKEESKAWITAFADEHDVTYNRIIEAADDYRSEGTYFVDGGKFEGCHVPEEFWEHYDIVTGAETPEEKRNNFFSCMC